MNPDNGFTLLDVREGDEWEQGHLDKAIFLPRGFLEVKADKMLTDRNQPIVVYCASTSCQLSRSFALRLLSLGFTNVQDMAGGMAEYLREEPAAGKQSPGP